MRCALAGQKVPPEAAAAAEILGEYFDQKSLAKLGFQAPIESLSPYREGLYLTIEDALAEARKPKK